MSQARFQAEVSDEEREQDEAMQDAFYEYSRSRNEDMDAYDLNDPKHPTYAERMADHADYLRQRAKDEAMEKSMMGGI